MKKKVLHILYSDKYSGAENVAISIIENLNEKYDFVYASKGGEIKKILEKKGIKCNLVNSINLKSVKKIIKEEKPDVIHAHDYFASTYVALSGFKGKIISHIHNDYPFAKKWNKYTLAFKAICKKFDYTIFVSNQVYKNAVFKNIIKNPIVLNNVIDTKNIEDLASKYSIAEKYDTAFIGRFTDQKNPLKFIEIIKNISEKKHDIKAVMLGDGELYEECKSKIKELKLENNIEIKGFVENPFPFIKNSTCIIMPSKYEGLGLSAIEALYLGRPVYFYYNYYKNSGMSDIYGGIKNDFTAEDDNDMTEKILKYLDNPKKPQVNLDTFVNQKNYYKKIEELYESKN